jgi:hypothetical protein
MRPHIIKLLLILIMPMPVGGGLQVQGWRGRQARFARCRLHASLQVERGGEELRRGAGRGGGSRADWRPMEG